MADSLITITVGLLEEPATVAERVLAEDGDPFAPGASVRLSREFASLFSVRDAKVTARIDSVSIGNGTILEAPELTVTFGSADITAGDTITIGSRTYTWAASASADGEITLSTTEATAAANLVEAVNGDATWMGLLSAEADGAVVTLTWLGDPRAGEHVGASRAETNSGSVTLGAATFATANTTIAGSSTARTWARGAA